MGALGVTPGPLAGLLGGVPMRQAKARDSAVQAGVVDGCGPAPDEGLLP